MSCLPIFVIDIILVVAFLFVLLPFLAYISHKNNYYLILWLSLAVLVIGAILHGIVIYHIPDDLHNGTNELSWFSIAVLSIISSAQMFVGGLRVFDNGFLEFLFSSSGHVYLVGLCITYSLSVSISIFVVFNFLFRRVFGRWILRFSRVKDGEVAHIFFGNNPQTMTLAKDIVSQIRKGKREKILLVEFPKKEDSDFDISFSAAVYDLIRNSDETGFFLRLKAKKSLAEIDIVSELDNPIFASQRIETLFGLNGIDKWIFRENTNLYFLSNDENENIRSLEVFKSLIEKKKAATKIGRIYCHSNKKNYEDRFRSLRVKWIDSSSLMIQQLIREDFSAMPINYVNIGQKSLVTHEESAYKEKPNVGYVTSEFNAAILGFGELGQNAFNFLFEYGAFVNQDKHRSGYHFYAFDRAMATIEDVFWEKHPALDRDDKKKWPVWLENGDFTDISFWKSDRTIITDKQANTSLSFSTLWPSLNYIFISPGATDTWEILKHLDKMLEITGKNEMLCVMVKHTAPSIESAYRRLKTIGSNIHFFGGMSDIWRYDVISEDSFNTDACKYFTAYSMAADNLGPKEAANRWQTRLDKLSGIQCDDRNALVRKLSQDYANCLHIPTKLKLIGKYDLLENASTLMSSIPDQCPSELPGLDPFAEEHCNVQDARLKELLLYLALEEHIRWEASHIVMGYKYNSVRNEDLKYHENLRNYEELTIGTRHYDWLVVKITLQLYLENKEKFNKLLKIHGQ